MDFHLMPLMEKVKLAMQTKDAEVLTLLMRDNSSRVRRVVARNLNTPKSVLKILSYDKVANVAFHAVNHPKCEVQRCIGDDDHPCVCCNLLEDKMNCNSCKRLKEFSHIHII